MMMKNITTKKLVWRLKESPTTEKISLLVSNGILTKEEAREILLNQETEEDRDKESLKSEIKFLRELVEKLANTQKVVEIIREVEPYWRRYRWWNPYDGWTHIISGTTATTTGDGILTYDATSFSDIKTF